MPGPVVTVRPSGSPWPNTTGPWNWKSPEPKRGEAILPHSQHSQNRIYPMFANIQEALESVTDDNGQISYSLAASIAIMHSIGDEFNNAYGHMYGYRVDAGELLVWLGY